MLKVSFVITVYNKAPFLPAVIDGLKAQTGPFEREFVFIDDGSSDNSVSVIQRETADLENVHIYQQENSGPSNATNTAVGLATGDWIKLVDADDILAPWCTRQLLEAAQQADLDCVFGSSGEHKNDQTPAFSQEAPGLDRLEVFTDPLSLVVEKAYARVSHTLIRRDKFIASGGCDAAIFVQDQSLFLNLATVCKMGYLREMVCSSPEDEPDRIMNNPLQLVHDCSLANARFIARHADMPKPCQKIIAKRLVSRLRKIARKVSLEARVSWNLRYFLLKCGMLPKPDDLVAGCDLYGRISAIRKSTPKVTIPKELS
ncbi:glycosyltransferase [Thalassospira sp. MA62]|nr:glycosyltransferase [Thalassospira sp. MA62]